MRQEFKVWPEEWASKYDLLVTEIQHTYTQSLHLRPIREHYLQLFSQELKQAFDRSASINLSLRSWGYKIWQPSGSWPLWAISVAYSALCEANIFPFSWSNSLGRACFFSHLLMLLIKIKPHYLKIKKNHQKAWLSKEIKLTDGRKKG